ARQAAVHGVKEGGPKDEIDRVAVVLGGARLKVEPVLCRRRQPCLDSFHHGHEPAQEVSRGHQVGQDVDPARLGLVVGVLAGSQILVLPRIGLPSRKYHLVRLSRYFQNLECCSTSCCSETGRRLRRRKSSSEFLWRM